MVKYEITFLVPVSVEVHRQNEDQAGIEDTAWRLLRPRIIESLSVEPDIQPILRSVKKVSNAA